MSVKLLWKSLSIQNWSQLSVDLRQFPGCFLLKMQIFDIYIFFGSCFHTKWFKLVDFNKLCWNEKDRQVFGGLRWLIRSLSCLKSQRTTQLQEWRTMVHRIEKEGFYHYTSEFICMPFDIRARGDAQNNSLEHIVGFFCKLWKILSKDHDSCLCI